MASVVKYLSEKALIKPPSFCKETHYEVIMGSVAYGCSGDMSDQDIYSVCIPPKSVVFPHTIGYINGFGKAPQTFETFQQHGIVSPDKKDVEYDINIYGIVKYFGLCMDNNPNMIDSLFVPQRCVIHSSEIGRHIRSHRHLFLSKNVKHRFVGYAYSQLSKLDNKKYENSKRRETVEKFGYDPKHLYHVRRLIGEAEQILTTADLDLELDNKALIAIRSGYVKPDEVKQWFYEKEKELDKLYHESKAVPHRPDEAKIKKILVDCLEMHYGSISELCRADDGVYQLVVNQIKDIISNNGV